MSLKSLYQKSPLATEHAATPLYSVEVQTAQGKKVFADPKVMRSLLLIMNQHAVNGGAACHWGGPAALAEMVSALYTYLFEHRDWSEEFHYVNDVGHAENILYCARALWQMAGLEIVALTGFRSIDSQLTGHGESHIFPQAVLLSNGPLSSALPQAQGLAMADHLLGNQRVSLITLSDGASMEGEAKESFAVIPGLRAKNKMNPFVMIISDNNTKLSGRIDQDSYSMQPTFESLPQLGWQTLSCDGHDLKACYETLDQAVQQARAELKPVCVILKTIKGKGMSETEQSSSGAHGYPLKAYDEKLMSFLNELWQGHSLPNWLAEMAKSALSPVSKQTSSEQSMKKEKIQVGVAKALISACEQGHPVVSVSADLQGSTGVAAFHKKFPQHSYDLGVVESNMISSAAGLSKQGLIPVVDTFAAFGVTKGNLPLVMGALSNAPVLAIFSHTGFQDAADGASHQSFTYFSALCSIPKTKLICLSTSEEAEFFISTAIEKMVAAKKSAADEYSYVFFLGRENFPATHQAKFNWDQPTVLKQGSEGVMVCYGSTVFHTLKAAEQLAAQGQNWTVIHHSFCNSENIELIAQCLQQNAGKLLTIEDHQINGGQGSFLISQLARAAAPLQKVRSLGMKGEFGRSAYSADQLYGAYGFDAQGIVNEVLEHF